MTLSVRKGARLEDPGAELLARGTALWDRYGRVALGTLAVIVLAGTLGFLFVRARASTEATAAGRLAEANALFWQGDYARSLELARQVTQQYPSAPSGIDAHRLAGDNAYWNGDFKAAATEYRAYLDKRKDGVLADAVRRSLAYSLESSGQYAEAAALYESLVGKLDRESSAEFLAASARCHRALNQPAEAAKRLQRLVDEFGETSGVTLARIQLAELSPPPSR